MSVRFFDIIEESGLHAGTNYMNTPFGIPDFTVVAHVRNAWLFVYLAVVQRPTNAFTRLEPNPPNLGSAARKLLWNPCAILSLQ